MDQRKGDKKVIVIEEFQVRGLTGTVKKIQFGSRTVDYWAPKIPGSRVLVAHDGQNVLDKRNIGINPHQRATWELAQSAVRSAEKLNEIPPTVICVYHTPYSQETLGRLKEYTPAKYMSREEDWSKESYGVYQGEVASFLADLDADLLLDEITQVIVPQITEQIGQRLVAKKTAILGASMGGLAAIYAVIQKPEYFYTALSFSPHWVIGGDPLAKKMMLDFPAAGEHKLWMSRGTKGLDARYEQSQDLANRIIRSRGYIDNANLITRTLNRGSHTNATWARYVPAALDFWMKKGKK